jgi:predicted phage-related endonuclease
MSLTAEQLNFRKGRVMASDVAAYVGLHPYAKPFEAWAANLGLADVEYSPAMRMGDVLEEPLIREAVTRLGWKEGYRQPGSIHHPRDTWAGCTPDAMRMAEVEEMPVGMQVKVSGLHMARDYKGQPGEGGDAGDNDLIPLYHLIQCQWEMFVTDAQEWYLVVYFGGADLRIYHLRRDRDLIGALRDNALAFWLDHLDPNGPQTQPPLDGSSAAAGFLRRKHPSNDGTLREAQDHHFELARRYVEARAKAKEWEQAASAAKLLLCQDVGDTDGIEGICTWKATSPKPKVDWESAAKSFDGWESVAKEMTTKPEGTRTFRLTFNSQE